MTVIFGYICRNGTLAQGSRWWCWCYYTILIVEAAAALSIKTAALGHR
jgi:hypothetical protein